MSGSCVDYLWRHRFGGSYSVSEDDEKIIFTHHLCSTGGRLIEKKASSPKSYGPQGWATLTEASPTTWGETDVPIYCGTCSWIHEIWPIHLFGEGAQWWIHASPFPKQCGDPCVHYIYKDPKDIPEAYYERIGMKKRGGGLSSEKVERMFTDAELEELSKGFMDLTIEAIDNNDIDAAKRWCHRFEETMALMHDFGVIWVSKAWSYIAEHFGEGAVNVFMRLNIVEGFAARQHPPASHSREKQLNVDVENVNTQVRVATEKGDNTSGNPGADAQKNLVPTIDLDKGKANFEAIMDFWRQHMTPLRIAEDDEKFILDLSCGSGGRLIDQGWYDDPGGHYRLKEAIPDRTWGKKDLPVYCSHCPMLHETMQIRYYGRGRQLLVHQEPCFPQNPGEPCVVYYYKDYLLQNWSGKDKIPDAFYQRLGFDVASLR